ncbi:zinc finger domain-containing protein [Corynebacterium sp. TAE3-ERU16]|uniref:zinc finger domain-containing protein n=1 Tax=Corynebacterium sp. TAE3-ERU16 TaxID=2849493 RepID=UPI003F8D634D
MLSRHEAVAAAARALGIAAALDQTVPQPSQGLLEEWAIQIERSRLTEEELVEGVRATYQRGEVPRSKITAYIAAARSLRPQNAVRTDVRSTPPARVVEGGVIPAAYAAHGALGVPCPSCRAESGEHCRSRSGTRRIAPCVGRLVRAHRTSLPPSVDLKNVV